MAVIDISEKLGQEPIKIKLAENQVFDADCSAEKYMILENKLNQNGFNLENMYEFIREILGEGAELYVKSLNPTVKQLRIIAIAISAAVTEESYEEMEKRFQKIQ